MSADHYNSPFGRIKMATSLPSTPTAYYGASNVITNDEWRGGEIVYLTGSATGANKLYIQTATSGKTATWKCLVTQFETV